MSADVDLKRRIGMVLVVALSFSAAVAQTQSEMNEGASKSFKAVSLDLSKAIDSYRQDLPAGQL